MKRGRIILVVVVGLLILAFFDINRDLASLTDHELLEGTLDRPAIDTVDLD